MGQLLMTLKDALDLGTTGVMAFAVIALWTRLNVVTDRFFDRLDRGDAERKVIAQEVGLDTEHFNNRTQQVLRAQRESRNRDT